MNAKPDTASVDFINYLNIGLMLASCALAYYMPFEVLLVSYAFLGPLHYLTEISWLHDKKYFVTGKIDPWFLVLPAIPITLAASSQYMPHGGWIAILVGVTFGAAAGMALCKSWKNKLITALVSLVVVLGLCNFAVISNFIALLLPSIVHVFIFTGAFILFGALKGDSKTGYASFIVFLLIPILFFVVQPNTESSQLSQYVQSNIGPFLQIREGMGALFHFEDSWEVTVAVIRFLAFAYTYHYFNWFSKTKIIRWHEMSKQRLVFLAAVYFMCISLYAIDYALGFVAAYFISLIHVFLEFPLNYHSFVGIGGLLKKKLTPAPG